MKDKSKRGKKRLSALQDESGMDDIAPYGTISIANCNPLNNTNQEDGKIRDAEQIKEIDPYGTSFINVPNPVNNTVKEDGATSKSVNANNQEEKEIKVMNNGNESKQEAGKLAPIDIYATVDKKRINKLEEQATSDIYATVTTKRENKLEAQDNIDPLENHAGVNKQNKGKEINDNDGNNKEIHQIYAEVDASAVSNPKPADDAYQEDGKNKDAYEVEEIDPYGTSSITNSNPVNHTNKEDREIKNAEEIDFYGTSSITNPNPVNYTNKEDREIKNAEEIEEIVPYGTSSVKAPNSVNNNHLEDIEIKAVNDGNESKVADEPAISDMYATVDKKGQNKLEDQATNDRYETVDRKQKYKLEEQNDVDHLTFYAVVNKQKKKEKEFN